MTSDSENKDLSQMSRTELRRYFRKMPTTWYERLPSSLIWFGIAGFLFYLLWWSPLTNRTAQADWLRVEAVITDNSVSRDPMRNEFQLTADFEAAVERQSRIYTPLLRVGRKNYLQKLAETTYAVGTEHSILVDPGDPDAFVLARQNWIGPWLVGFLPGVFCCLIAVSILFFPETPQSVETKSEGNGNQDR